MADKTDDDFPLRFDGWYKVRADADGIAGFITEQGATVIGIIESPNGSHGVLYLTYDPKLKSDFPNHALSEWLPDWRAGN